MCLHCRGLRSSRPPGWICLFGGIASDALTKDHSSFPLVGRCYLSDSSTSVWPKFSLLNYFSSTNLGYRRFAFCFRNISWAFVNGITRQFFFLRPNTYLYAVDHSCRACCPTTVLLYVYISSSGVPTPYILWYQDHLQSWYNDWRTLAAALLISCVGILVISLTLLFLQISTGFRVAELSEGFNGRLATSEAFFFTHWTFSPYLLPSQSISRSDLADSYQHCQVGCGRTMMERIQEPRNDHTKYLGARVKEIRYTKSLVPYNRFECRVWVLIGICRNCQGNDLSFG